MLSVAVREVRAGYSADRPVLDDISLTVVPGELFFLLGPSGCGKTTLLRLIAGFLRPERGSVWFGDEDVTNRPVEQRGIGLVFQQYALWPHLTVAENVRFGLDVAGTAAAEKTRRVDEMLALVELSGFGQRRIGELSGGQQQRVALARALVIKPKVLLLDEPLSNLDARLRGSMRREIRRICKTVGATAIYVTHDQKEALSTADRIALMERGKIVQLGTPSQIYDRPVSSQVAAFIGEANLVLAKLDGEIVSTPFAQFVTRALGEGVKPGPATLCVRPEKIHIGANSANSFSGVIAERSFLGDHTQWTIRCGDQSLTVVETSPPERKVGDQVQCWVDPNDVTVLPP